MTKTDQIKAELLAIQARSSDNILHVAKVLHWTKAHPKSALYSQIEWDDGKAAADYRLWQVRRLIQIHVVSDMVEPLVVSLTVDRGHGGGYRSIDDVVGDRFLSDIMLSDALAELERVRVRYERVVELTAIWQEVERVKKQKTGAAEAGRQTGSRSVTRQARLGVARLGSAGLG